MKPSNSLHQLLHSLSQTEKRYLRLYTTRHILGDQNQYSLLMDLILRQQEYDEGKLKLDFASQGGSIQQFASLKNYLFGWVLQAMRDFQRARNLQGEVEDLLEDAAFLTTRGMRSEATKLLDKALDKAEMLELHGLQLQGHNLARIAVSRALPDDIDIVLADLEIRSEAALQAQQLATHMAILYFKTFRLSRISYHARSPEAIKQLEEIRMSPVLQQARSAPAFLPQMYLLRIMALIAQMENRLGESLQLHEQLLALWSAFPKMKDLHQGPYIVAMANLLGLQHVAGNYVAMPGVLAQLSDVVPNSPALEIEIRQNHLYYKLLHAINTGAWEAAPQSASAIQTLLDHHTADLPKARVIAIRYNIAITYFFLEQPKQALTALNNILNDEQTRHREDIQQAARLMQAVVHYQLGNLDLLEYLLRSVKRYLKNRNALHAFEETLIHHLKRLIAHPQDKKEILLSLKAALEALRSDPDNANAPGLEEVKHWTNSMLEGRPIRDFVHESENEPPKSEGPKKEHQSPIADPQGQAPNIPTPESASPESPPPTPTS